MTNDEIWLYKKAQEGGGGDSIDFVSKNVDFCNDISVTVTVTDEED